MRRTQGNGTTAGRAGGNHDEWFEVEEQTARRVVDLWASFAEQLPYDRFGRLVDFWSGKIDGESGRVGDGNAALDWLETMPQLVEELRRWEFGTIAGHLGRLSL